MVFASFVTSRQPLDELGQIGRSLLFDILEEQTDAVRRYVAECVCSPDVPDFLANVNTALRRNGLLPVDR